MNEWNFEKIEKYVEWIKDNKFQNFFSYKVGIFNKNRFYFDGLGTFFLKFIPDPPQSKKDPSIESPIGLHSYKSVILKESIYAQKEFFIRQGDILKSASIQNDFVKSHPPTHWMVTSHTCNLDNDKFISLCAAYEKPSFIEHGKNLRNWREENFWGVVSENTVSRFLILPPSKLLSEEPIAVDLSQILTFPKELAKIEDVVSSLTYPGLAYFSCRLSMYLHRDVERWDDKRVT